MRKRTIPRCHSKLGLDEVRVTEVTTVEDRRVRRLKQAPLNPGAKFCLLPVFLINNMRDIPMIDKFVHLAGNDSTCTLKAIAVLLEGR